MSERKSTGGKRQSTGGKRKSVARKSLSRKSVAGGKRKSMGGTKRKSIVGATESKSATDKLRKSKDNVPTRTRPIKPIDLFHSPYPIWEDWAINETKWDEMPELVKMFRGAIPDVLKGRQASTASGGKRMSMKGKRMSSGGKRGSVKRQSTGGKRGSVKRQSTGGKRGSVKRQSTGGKRGSVKRQSTGGKRGSVKRQSTGGGGKRGSVKRQSTGGKRGSVKRQSTGGKRKSTGGQRKSLGGKRKSMAPGGVGRKSTVKTISGKDEKKDFGPFIDPEGHAKLPPYLKPVLWRRAPWPDGMPPTLEGEEGSLDLYTRNTHLFQYKILRLIISAVMSLERAGTIQPFPVEYQTESFISNTRESWKPWHHVYALTKAGESTTHKPLFNPYGLYYVRIYYLGEWRRIAVDEYFPYDAQGQMLLPVSKNPLNIWMPLLTKALLKIASLSWTSWDDSLDFDPIACMTGWLKNTIDARFMKEAPIWRIIQSHLIRQKNPDRPHCVPLDVNNCIHETANVYLDQPGSRYVFLEFSDRPDPELGNQVEKCPLDACYHHYALLAAAENDTVPDDLPKWKSYRWVNWAMEKGYIRGHPGSLRRIIDVYVPLKKKPPDVEIITKLNETDGTVEKTTPKQKSDVYLFEEIANCIEKIHVFYRPPYFEYAEILDNIPDEVIKIAQSERKSTADKRDMKKFTPEELRNMNITGDCFYLYSDTLYCKNFLFTLICHNENREMPAVEMADAYTKLIKMAHGSPQHTEQLAKFISSFCPPYILCSFIPNPVEPGSILTIHDLMPLFEQKVMEMLYEQVHPSQVDKIVSNVLGFQRAFLDEKFGEKYLSDSHEPFRSDAYKKIMNIKNTKWDEFYLDRLNNTRKLDGLSLLDKLPEDDDATTADLKPRASKGGGKRMSVKRKSKGDGGQRKSTGSKRGSVKRKSTGGKRGSVKRQSTGGKRGSVKRKSTGGDGKKESAKRPSTGGKRGSVKIQAVVGKRGSVKRQSTGGKRGSMKRGSVKGGSKKRVSSLHGGSRGKSVKQEIHYNQFLLENPVNDANLLRQMVKSHDHLLRKYPFRYDDIFRLNYFDVASVTEQINYPTKWLLVGRIWLNVHSQTPVPVGFSLFTETTPVTMSLYDLDKREEVPLGLNINANYFVKRNEKGYVLLVHGWPAQEKRDKSAQWRVRCFGAEIPDIPHGCNLTPPYGWTKEEADRAIKPYDPGAGEFKLKEEIKKEDMSFSGEKWGVCRGEKGPNPILTIHTISGNYIPNYKASICRFLITMPSDLLPPAALVTLCLNTSKSDVKINLTLKGKDGKVICDNQGIGNCIVPAVFLFVKDAEIDRLPDMGEELELSAKPLKEGEQEKDTVFFRGEAVVVENSWNFTKQEAEILETIRKDASLSASGDTKAVVPGAPNWKLIMVVDNLQRNDVQLAADRRYEDNFKRVRDEIWEVREPGRKEKGLAVRMDFLTRLYPAVEEDEEEDKVIEDEVEEEGWGLKLPSIKKPPDESRPEPENPNKKEEERQAATIKTADTDFVQIELGSSVMAELYAKHRNPNEEPDFVPRVVHLKPAPLDFPRKYQSSVLGETVSEADELTETVELYEEEHEAMPDQFKIIDPILEEAQLALKDWGNKKIKKAYAIRDEMIEEMKKDKALKESVITQLKKDQDGRVKESRQSQKSVGSRKSLDRKSIKRKSMKRQSVARKSLKRQSVRRQSKKK